MITLNLHRRVVIAIVALLVAGCAPSPRPRDARLDLHAVRFDADGKKVMAQVSGRFLVVRTTEQTLPGQTAVVQGTLYTTAEVEK